jgi:hypothetical protein
MGYAEQCRCGKDPVSYGEGEGLGVRYDGQGRRSSGWQANPEIVKIIIARKSCEIAPGAQALSDHAGSHLSLSNPTIMALAAWTSTAPPAVRQRGTKADVKRREALQTAEKGARNRRIWTQRGKTSRDLCQPLIAYR